MNNSALPIPNNKNELGFHYFQDTLHYREKDIEIWLPKLSSLGASWLVCKSPNESAIPEAFLTSLRDHHIEPIVQFDLPLASVTNPSELIPILSSYSRWGVKYALSFNQPNSRSSWTASSWSQIDIVERFLDRYIPFAIQAMDNGLVPVFPALEPGGDFWDTAFLQEALQSLQRRKQFRILDQLTLSAFGWTFGHSLNWGAGGAGKWNTTQPYLTPPDAQDQRGFRTFEWYQEIARKVTGKPCNVIVLQAGRLDEAKKNIDTPLDSQALAETHLAIAKLCARVMSPDPCQKNDNLIPLSESVVACNLWLLAAEGQSNLSSLALYTSQGSQSPSVHNILKWREKISTKQDIKPCSTNSNWRFVMKHYILLPTLDGAPTDWHLDIVRPYLKKYSPTLGYSPQEAAYSARVTVIGGEEFFSEELLTKLRTLGCQVERLEGSGTSIATLLSTR